MKYFSFFRRTFLSCYVIFRVENFFHFLLNNFHHFSFHFLKTPQTISPTTPIQRIVKFIAATAEKKLPVIVFLHGESFEWNSGNPFDGTVLASYGEMVVVTLNYRLGLLGMLYVAIYIVECMA